MARIFPAQSALSILGTRELTREDLGKLATTQRAKPRIQALRETHHRLARLLAAGLNQQEAGIRAGYGPTRVGILMKDPTFADLVDNYRKQVNAAYVESQDEFYSLSTENMMKAERMLADKLDQVEAEGDLPSFRDLLAITSDKADRFGYSKKSTTVNINVDFASRLEAARRRSATKTIEAQPSAPQVPPPAGASGGVVASPLPQPFRRRA